MRFFNRALSKPIESSSRGGGADVAIQDSVDCFSAKALRNDENEGFRKSSNTPGPIFPKTTEPESPLSRLIRFELVWMSGCV